jgi:hypothetical protein
MFGEGDESCICFLTNVLQFAISALRLSKSLFPPVGLQILLLCVAAGSPPDVLLCLFSQDILRVTRLTGPQDFQLHRPRRRQQHLQVQRIQIQ